MGEERTAREITGRGAPKPRGTYAQAVQAESLLFCSTQLPLDPTTGVVPNSGAYDQAIQCLANLDEVCAGAQTDLDRALVLRVYFTGRDDWGAIERAFADRFVTWRPARVPIHVVSLSGGALVSMEATVLVH